MNRLLVFDVTVVVTVAGQPYYRWSESRSSEARPVVAISSLM
jgi:hypothetical protein